MNAGILRVDAVLASVTEADDREIANLGVQAGWLIDAIDRARVVLLESNASLPSIEGFPSLQLAENRFIVAVETKTPLLNFSQSSREELSPLGTLGAKLIPQGALLQYGLGAGVKAVLDHLRQADRRHEIHSGLITDDVVDLHADQGYVTTPLLAGTARLLDWAASYPRLRGVRLAWSHDVERLAQEECFVALNGAARVDLLGNIDCEEIDQGVRGAAGGHADFAFAAARSPRGLSIIALSSRRADGTPSIIPQVSATTPKLDVDFVVTEFGVADLRGATVSERARAIASLAHPDDQSALFRHAEDSRLLG
jgi:acetyl-CoA hydrolase